jgi:hypothetical protein
LANHDNAERAESVGGPTVIGGNVHARDHRVFAGKLDKADLSIAERVAVRVVHAPYGDGREWGEIRSWAATIATELTAPPAPGPRVMDMTPSRVDERRWAAAAAAPTMRCSRFAS